eukprot:1215801-Prorocentrum_lima.AAC.1
MSAPTTRGFWSALKQIFSDVCPSWSSKLSDNQRTASLHVNLCAQIPQGEISKPPTAFCIPAPLPSRHMGGRSKRAAD